MTEQADLVTWVIARQAGGAEGQVKRLKESSAHQLKNDAQTIKRGNGRAMGIREEGRGICLSWVTGQ